MAANHETESMNEFLRIIVCPYHIVLHLPVSGPCLQSISSSAGRYGTGSSGGWWGAHINTIDSF